MRSKNTYVMLFNYGGGMRGLIPARFMAELEETTGLRMTDMVDVFTGPSTGAILNAALNVPHPDDPSRPKFKARHMVRFYERDGIKIFPRDRFREFRGFIHDFNNRTMKISKLKSLFAHGHYNPQNLGKSLGALFGKTNLTQTLKSLVIPVYNLDGEHLEVLEEKGDNEDTPVPTHNNFVDRGGYAVWLKNMKTPALKPFADQVSLFDAVTASCAAPTYFPSHHFSVTHPGEAQPRHYAGIDGSIFDNPCISYHGAVRPHIPKNADIIIIALGTGHTLRSFKREDWNRYGGLGIVDPMNDLPLINILFHATETALMESFTNDIGSNIYLFNKSMIAELQNPQCPSLQIDDASPENLKNLHYFFEATLEENKAQFEKLCDVLVRNYEQRNRKSLWPF